MKPTTFKDVNRKQTLYSLCTDASRFIGFPERAEAVYNFIFTNSGKKGIVLSKQGIPIKDNKYVITEKTFSVKELLKKR